jgi:hypothetical protein
MGQIRNVPESPRPFWPLFPKIAFEFTHANEFGLRQPGFDQFKGPEKILMPLAPTNCPTEINRGDSGTFVLGWNRLVSAPNGFTKHFSLFPANRL